MSTSHTPANAAEADSLRAYVPTDTLVAIAALSKAESAECDTLWRKRDETTKAINETKERMRRDRALLKDLERKQKTYSATLIYQRTDAARDASWQAARIARDAAIAAGESPKFETMQECTARLAHGEAAK